MKRTALNAKARKKIAAIAQEKNLQYCEARLPDCLVTSASPAHKHKRDWYKGKPDHLLWDFDQWLALCQNCHHKQEYDKELSKLLFKRLRP